MSSATQCPIMMVPPVAATGEASRGCRFDAQRVCGVIKREAGHAVARPTMAARRMAARRAASRRLMTPRMPFGMRGVAVYAGACRIIRRRASTTDKINDPIATLNTTLGDRRHDAQ